MSFLSMRTELRGSVPKLPFSYTSTLINRAWSDIRSANLWGFQLVESAWISPPQVSAGTVNAVQGSNSLTFDATAIAALLASQVANTYSPITVRQFRIQAAGIYNIISINFGTGVALLDRIYADPSGTQAAYSVYQAYYVAPFLDFIAWKSVVNPQMFLNLGLDKTRAEIDALDPQRAYYAFPSEVVPFGYDNRGAGTANASATLGFKMYELWGQAITPYTYQCYGLRHGAELVNPADTLPFGITEELVMYRARYHAYEWAEANKDMSPRSSGPDFKFLMGQVNERYNKKLTQQRKQDKEFIDNWFSQRSLTNTTRGSYYNTLAGVAGSHGPQ